MEIVNSLRSYSGTLHTEPCTSKEINYYKIQKLMKCECPDSIVIKDYNLGEVEIPMCDKSAWRWIKAILGVYGEDYFSPKEVEDGKRDK